MPTAAVAAERYHQYGPTKNIKVKATKISHKHTHALTNSSLNLLQTHTYKPRMIIILLDYTQSITRQQTKQRYTQKRRITTITLYLRNCSWMRRYEILSRFFLTQEDLAKFLWVFCFVTNSLVFLPLSFL